jgi:hypothetical protein
MRMLLTLPVFAALSCSATDPFSDASDADLDRHGPHGPPRLSSVPAWSATGSTAGEGGCFGAAVALGDLDGDDRLDLIVGEASCAFTFPATAGRLAIYRGTGVAFADTPVWTPLTWTNPPRGGTALTLATADVDGDCHLDLVVGARAGVQVFTGIDDLAAPLGDPSLRVPGTGNFGGAVVADVDGDGSSEIVSVRANAATVWRASAGALVAARVLAPASVVVAAGDSDHDGDDDLVVTQPGHSDLYRGCAEPAVGCDGGLEAAPAWGSDRPVLAMVPDIDGDDLDEALLGDPPFNASGRMWLHLSDPVTGIAATPAWSTLGDPNYPVLGRPIVAAGDLDGDHRRTELLVGAAGRTYAFFPTPHHVGELEPGFAWPRHDTIQGQLNAGEPTFGNTFTAIATGRVGHDHYTDVVLAVPPELDDPRPGQVLLFRGGKRRHGPHADPAPYLLGEQVCELPTDPAGKPDLFVDPDSLARSLYVEHRAFTADSCEILEQCVDAPGTRRLLRFATSIANLGAAPVIIPGPETAPELYHFDECHGHDHLEDFARYELVDDAGTTVAIGRKQGFFLVDTAPYCSDGEPRADYFPDQGISPGWSDVYVASLPCQWLDVTDVADGTYDLNVSADTLGLVDQTDVLPDTATVRIHLAGDQVTILP